jgi:hypothetical protein
VISSLAAASALIASSIPLVTVSAEAGTAALVQPEEGGGGCKEVGAQSTRRRVFTDIVGGLAGRLFGSSEAGRTISSYIPAEQMLTDAVIALLDCDEQQRAARATQEVTVQAERSGAGATAAWESESRPGVSGTSTVTAVEDADGRRCMTVTDVIIIDGEETTVPKRLCRTPPSTRYARV